jgi:uncharacterized membrane protein
MNVTLPNGLLTAVAATGAVAAGAVLLEAAIVPGLLIGAAAVLAPQLVLGRGRAKPRQKTAQKTTQRRGEAPLHERLSKSLGDLTHIKFSRSVVKTITFRVIVTSLDFTANYLVLQQASTAAGLSAISLVGGPLFYFLHETAWNYLVGSGKLQLATSRLPQSLATNHPLVKTITYRTFATIVEFTTNYVVVGDLATAALLSSFGFFLGPFVYYGHELAWERFSPEPPARRRSDRAPVIIDVEPIEEPIPGPMPA